MFGTICSFSPPRLWCTIPPVGATEPPTRATDGPGEEDSNGFSPRPPAGPTPLPRLNPVPLSSCHHLSPGNREMNRDPILFRVDGTPRTGWERLSRCLVFAAALQRRRRPTYFLSQL